MKEKMARSMQILCIGVVLGTFFCIGVFLLPTKAMHDNVKDSLVILEEEGLYPQLIKGYIGSRLDNFTDAIMLTNVIGEENDSVIENAFNVNRIYYKDKNPVESLCLYAKNAQEHYNVSSYARYWHGYLVILKPLFLLFTYSSIRLWNSIGQIAVVILFVKVLIERGLKRYLLPFLLSLIYVFPGTISKSLQLSSVFYVAMFSMIALTNIKNRKYDYLYFLCIGMATSFFDLLTYPLATLGLPLTLYFVLFDEEDNIKSNLRKWIELCFFWGCGYTGMWMGKWFIASIFTSNNIFMDAIIAVLLRSSRSASSEPIFYTDIVKRNIDVMLLKKEFLILGLIVLGYMIVTNLLKKKTVQWTKSVPYLLTMMLPFAWYGCLGNHSYIHFWFTFRSLVVAVFAISCMCEKIFTEKCS